MTHQQLFKTEQAHFEDVQKLQAALKKQRSGYSLKSNAPSNSLRSGAYKKKESALDFSTFNQVLQLNTDEKWVVVEPRIDFAHLCRFTLSYGFIPPVVPEFSSITVGGAIMGAALESSSHQFGQFNDICLEYELLLGNGEKLFVSKEAHPELFYGVCGSYGTLALLTAVKLRLIRAKKWVNLTCLPYRDLGKMVDQLTTKLPNEFVEGIVLNPAKGVIVSGNMSDKPQGDVFRQNRPWSCWYVQQIAHTQNSAFSMLLEEYLFRLDRAAFWMGSYVNHFPTMLKLLLKLKIPHLKQHTFNPSALFRFLFGWALSSKRLYQNWHRIPQEISQNLFFIHDFYAPFQNAKKMLDRFIEQANIFPIWLCPVKGTHTPQILSPHYGQDAFLNIGIYGIPKSTHSVPKLSALFEKEIVDFGGRKMLYSYTYYSKESFAHIYQESWYESLRKKFFAEKAFPSLYNKVINNSRV